MAVTERWGGLRIEPYKPNPKDADLDQIVQEGTVWERPKGTFIADDLGNLLQEGVPGRTMEDRRGRVIVDRNGNRVDYTPSWSGQRLSTGERFPTVGQSNGTIAENSRTIGDTRGTINTAPKLDEEKLSFLRELSNSQLEDYINASITNRDRNGLSETDSEWLAAALAVRSERQGDKTPEQIDVEERTPDGWGETVETVVKNTKVDNDLGPIISGDELEEAVDGYSWQKEKKARLMLARERAKKVFNLIWRKDGDISKAPWEVPDPEDENGELIDETFEDAGQKFIALSRQQKEDYLKKMFMDGEEVELGTKTVDGEEYKVTAEHIVDFDRTRFPSDLYAEQQRRFEEGQGPPPSPERAQDNTILVRGRWHFRLYDKDGNLVYDSEEGPNPTSTGDYANGGTARELRLLEGQMLMENLGTDHTARFMRDGKEVEVELRSLDESLADIFNTNTFTFANEIGIEKARLVASDKGVVVWAHKGYTPSKTSASTTQSLVTAGKLVKAWERVDELRQAKRLDPNNPEHAELIIAAAVLGDRERYLRVKGMLSDIDVDKLPQSAFDIYSADEKAVSDALKEAGTSFDKAPKGDDILHAMLPSSGKLRDNVLAFNMWSLGENKRKGLDPRQRSEAIRQTPEVPELSDAMGTYARNNDTLMGLPTWTIVDPNAEVLISDGEQDLKPFKAPDDIRLVPEVRASRTTFDDPRSPFYSYGSTSEEAREFIANEMYNELFDLGEIDVPEGNGSFQDHKLRNEIVSQLISFLDSRPDLPLGDPDAKEKIKAQFVETLNQRMIYRRRQDKWVIDKNWDGRLWSIKDGRLVFLETVPKKRFGKKKEGTYTVKELEEMGIGEMKEMLLMTTDKQGKEIDEMLVRVTDYENPFDFARRKKISLAGKQEDVQQALDDNPVIVNGFSGGVLFYANETPEAIQYKNVMEGVVPLLSNILNSNNGNTSEERVVISFVPTDAYMEAQEARNEVAEKGAGFGGYFAIKEIGTGTEPVKRIHISGKGMERRLQKLADPNTSEEKKKEIKDNLQSYALSILTHEYHHALDASVTDKATEYTSDWRSNHTYHSNNAMTAVLVSGGYLEVDERGDLVPTQKGKDFGIDVGTVDGDADKLIGLISDEDIEKAFPLKPDGTREDMAGYHMARVLVKIYNGRTVRALQRDDSARDSGSYWNTPVEALARISEDAVFMQILAENDLLDFHPEVEIALFEKIRRDVNDWVNSGESGFTYEEAFKEVLDYWRYWQQYEKHGGDRRDPSEEVQEFVERIWSFTRAKEERLDRVSPEVRAIFEGSNKIEWKAVGEDNSYPVAASWHFPQHFTYEEIADVSDDFYGWLKGIDALEKDFKPVKIDPNPLILLQSSESYRAIERGEDVVDTTVSAVGGVAASPELPDPTDGGLGAPKPPPAAVVKRRGVVSRLMERVQFKKPDLERFKLNFKKNKSLDEVMSTAQLDEALDIIASTQKADAVVEQGNKLNVFGIVDRNKPPVWTGQARIKPGVDGGYYKDSNRIIVIKGRDPVDILVHEAGHGYDYRKASPQGYARSAIKETFQNLVKKNAVFEKFMRKYLPERFRDKPVLMAIKDKEERFKSEVGSIKITKDKIYDNAIKRFPTRIRRAKERLEKRGISDPTKEQIVDEFFDAVGITIDEKSFDITFEELQKRGLFEESVRVDYNPENGSPEAVLKTLSKMSDDEFEELLEDMPYAMQARVRYVRAIAMSSKYEALSDVTRNTNILEGLITGDEDVIYNSVILNMYVLKVRNMVSDADVKDVNILDFNENRTLVPEVNQQIYMRKPEELWAFGYAQSMTLERISQLAGGDEEAKALLQELVSLHASNVIYFDDKGNVVINEAKENIPQDVLDVVNVLKAIEINNPELFKLANKYVEERALAADDLLIRKVVDIQNVDDSFTVKNALLGVITDDGMSANPDAAKPKRVSAKIDPKKRNDIVSNFENIMGDRQLSVDEAVKLIPDGKLDVYIDAHENSEDVVDLNGTVISRTEIDEDVYRRIQNKRLAIAAKMKQEKKRRNLDKPSYRSDVLASGAASSPTPDPDFMDMDDFMDISSDELDLMEPDEIRELAEDLEIENIPKTTSLIKRRIMSTMAERFDDAKRQRAEKKNDELSRAKKFSTIYGRVVRPFVEKTAERFIARKRAAKGIRSDDPIELQEALEQGDEGVEKMLRNLDKFTPFAEALGKSLHTGKLRAKIASLSRPFRVGKAPTENVGERLRKRSEIRIQELQKLIKNEGAKNTTRKLLETMPDDLKEWLLKNYASVFNDEDINESDLNNLAEKFVSQLHSAWAGDSQIISAQLAAAEMAGMSREEIIQKVFWMPFYKENRKLNPKEKEAVINVLLDAYDDDKRIAIVYRDSLEGAGKVTSWGIEGRPLDDWDTIVSLAAGATYEDLDKIGGTDEDDIQALLGITAEEILEAEDKFDYTPVESELAKATMDGRYHPEDGALEWDSPTVGINKQSIKAIKHLLETESATIQQVLKDAGIERVTLYRGIKTDSPDTPSNVKYAPLASFALDAETAMDFAEGDGFIVEVAVPVEAIVSGFPQGFGSFPENEFIIDTSKLDNAPTAVRDAEAIMNRTVREIDSIRQNNDNKLPEGFRDNEANPYSAFTKSPAIYTDEYVEETLKDVIGQETGLDMDNATDEEIDEALKAQAEKIKEDLPDIEKDMNQPPGMQGEGWTTVEKISDVSVRQTTLDKTSVLEYDDTDINEPPLNTMADSGIPDVDDEITYERSDEDVTVTVAEPIESIAAFHKEKKDWSQVTAVEPSERADIGRTYASEPDLPKEQISGEVTEAWTALADEVEEQWDIITKPESEGGLGITVEFVDEDPYGSYAEMRKDFIENKRIKVLKTEVTGGHPFFTNEQNDKFRAVHDIFGHLGTGRGFDRHGEEAAYQAHRSMFTGTAQKALATELRGQNTYLLTYGDFGPQKLFILPENMRKALSAWLEILTKVTKPWSFLISSDKNAVRDSDEDNLYDISGSHHVSCGRYMA